MHTRVYWLLAGIAVAAAIAILDDSSCPERTPADRHATGDHVGRRFLAACIWRELNSMHRRSESRFAVSPDGRKLALIAADESGRTRLWLRDLGVSRVPATPRNRGCVVPVLVARFRVHRIRRCGEAQSHPPVWWHADDGDRLRLPHWGLGPGRSHPVRADALLAALRRARVWRRADTRDETRHGGRRSAARGPGVSAGRAALLVLQHRQPDRRRTRPARDLSRIAGRSRHGPKLLLRWRHTGPVCERACVVRAERDADGAAV